MSMENFFKNIKLIDSFSVKLNASKSEFASAFRANVDQGDADGWFSGMFEGFSSSKNLYVGEVNHNGFKIRRRRRFFERNFGKAVAKGSLRQENDILVVDTEINGWHNFMYFFYIFITIIYVSFFISSFFGIFSEGSSFPVFAIFFILIHAAFMYGLPYFMMRRSVRILREDLEREFHFVLSKSNSL